MVEVVINYDRENNVFKAYEPTTDTLFVTASLGDTFNKLEAHLLQYGLIAGSLLADQNITYHLDSPTFVAMVQSNANLLKRLNNAPSGFMISSQRLGLGSGMNSNNGKDWKNKKSGYSNKKTGTFSKSNLSGANKKFGNK